MQHPHALEEISGVLTYIANATAALAPLGVKVRSFSTHHPTWREVWQAVRGCDLVHLNSNHIALLFAARMLKRPILIKYHYPFWWENVAQPYIPKSLPDRLLSDARFHWSEYRFVLPWWRRLLPVMRAIGRSLLRLFVGLVVDHRTACSRYLAETTDLPGTVEVDYNPIDFSQPPSQQREDWPGQEPLFLYVGRVDRTKGVDVLLQAADILVEAGHTFRIELIGQGDHLEELRAQIAQRKLESRVVIRGRLPHGEVQRAMSRALAVVVPSRWNDPAPYVVVEALVAGRVCLGSRMGGIPELIDDPESLFENGDAPSLARQLAALLRLPAQATARARKARETVRLKCDLPIAGARLKGIYERLLRHHSSAPSKIVREICRRPGVMR